MKKSLGILATILVAFMFITGCSNGSNAKSTNNSSENTSKKEKNNHSKAQQANLTNKSFKSDSSATLENSIAFKKDKFIWNYSATDKSSQDGSIKNEAIFVGNYNVSGNKLTLSLNNKSTDIYRGTVSQLKNHQYMNYFASKDNPKKVVFEISKNSLKLISKNNHVLVDGKMTLDTSITGSDNYVRINKLLNSDSVYTSVDSTKDSNDNASNSNNVNKPAEESTNDSNSSNESNNTTGSAVNSADDFENFLKSNGAIESDGDYKVMEGNGYDFHIADSDTTVTAKYQVSWDIDGGAITHIYILGNDGKIYVGNSGSLMMEVPSLTSKLN